MIRLSAATVLLQWSVGGLFFLWVTTRRREVGLGYGWLLRGVYLAIAVGAVAAGRAVRPDLAAGRSVLPELVRDLDAAMVALAAAVALTVSVVRRQAGVAGQRRLRQRRAARVAAMTHGLRGTTEPEPERLRREFPPALDLVAPVIGLVGLVAAGVADAAGSAGGGSSPWLLAVVRTLTGAALFGAVSDAMLLGHWYLVQPGLGRSPLNQLVRWTTVVWPFEVVALLWPTGMPDVLSGRIKDGYGGILGWFWVACAVGTLALSLVTKAALKERYYSAVMAATGLLYLAILTAFGTDLVARAILAG
jgi:hypothetical protein